ncbi:tyrosine-type recombinase/integrase [Paeniglutamicibacter sp. R2-26]|uniref:tyrosine-type recombinase/integrase n=1 Tax=Paeniglutamicibacter sp. R2-26 TaxID=3144417 RepID=UPI003EE4D435
MARPKLKAEENGSIASWQLSTGQWVASAYYRTLGGEMRRVKRTRSTKGTAIKAVKDKLQQLRAAGGTSGTNVDATLEQTLAAWLASIEVEAPEINASGEALIRQSKGMTVQTFRQHVRHADFILKGLGGVETAALTTGQCEAFLHGLVDRKNEKGYSTARLAKVTLSQVMNYAVRMGIRRENPVDKVAPLPKKVTVPMAPGPELIDDMRIWIRAYTESDGRYGPKPNRRVSDVFELLLATGARIGEVMALRWQDVDLPVGTVTICGTLVERGALYRQPMPKSERSNRTLRLTPWALELLQELHTIRDKGSVSGGVFVTRSGRFASMSGVRRSIRGALAWSDAEGTAGVNPHAFRKAVATILAEGLGENAAMQQLGHSSPDVTRKSYIQRPDVVPNYTHLLERLAPRGRGENS